MFFKSSLLTLSHLRSELLYFYYRGDSRWRGNCLFSETCSPFVKEMGLKTSSFPLIIRMSFSYCLLKSLLVWACPVLLSLLWYSLSLLLTHSVKIIVPTYIYSLLSFTHTISPMFDFESVPSNSQLNISLTCHLKWLLSSFFWPHGYTEDI